ncbi:MCAT, partial [Symbiodinium necroappetens]
PASELISEGPSPPYDPSLPPAGPPPPQNLFAVEITLAAAAVLERFTPWSGPMLTRIRGQISRASGITIEMRSMARHELHMRDVVHISDDPPSTEAAAPVAETVPRRSSGETETERIRNDMDREERTRMTSAEVERVNSVVPLEYVDEEDEPPTAPVLANTFLNDHRTLVVYLQGLRLQINDSIHARGYDHTLQPVQLETVQAQLGKLQVRKSVPPGMDMAFAADEEMDTFFGTVSTKSSERASNSSDTPQGKRRREFVRMGPRGDGGSGWNWQGDTGRDNGPLVPTLARLAIKLDEEIRVLKQNTGIVLWMKPGADSVLPHLYNTAVEFKKQQKDNPKFSLAHVPLRSVLALAMFRELGNRLDRLLKTPDLMKAAETRGWRDQSGWKYQVWNGALRHLEVDREKPT